jgi:hypothetical protein
MNKKELAKLLLQTTQIRELFESQQFDTATISKVIAQEIMREQEEGEQGSAPTLPELKANLKFAMAQLEGYRETFAQKRNEYRVARTDGDSDTADDARFDMETIKTLIKDEDEKIQNLSNKIDLLKNSAQAAAKTASQDDDQVVAAVAKRVGDEIKAAAELLSNNPEDNTNVAGQIAQSVVEPIKQAVNTVKKVTAAEPTAEPKATPEAAPEAQPPAAPGWKNAKAAAANIMANAPSHDAIRDSLESLDAFQSFWNVKGAAETKLQQARELFDQGYFKEKLNQVQKLAASDNPEEQSKSRVVATNLAATVMGYNQFLNTLAQERPEFTLPTDFAFPTEIPKT